MYPDSRTFFKTNLVQALMLAAYGPDTGVDPLQRNANPDSADTATPAA